MGAEADEVVLRPAEAGDLDEMIAITREVFAEQSVDGRVERMIGRSGPGDWADVKAQALRREVRGNPGSCFVAELGGRVVGYVTNIVDELASRGTIANLAVSAACQGRGTGRRLILRSIERFRELGLTVAKIETLATNPVGQHLYPSVGFREVVRQIHYVMPLD